MPGTFYQLAFRTIFTHMDPEFAHRCVVAGLKRADQLGIGRILESLTAPGPELEREVMGITWPSPFGLAAGFDKGATAVLPLATLGFGHIEIGTVTAQAQPGNPRPRLFRLVADSALINRMGFNNDGAEAVRDRLTKIRDKARQRRRASRHVPVIGVNIGKTKAVALEDAVEDYRASAAALAPVADYLVVNVSSPNTPGLRQLQDIASLGPLLTAVREAADAATTTHVPLLVKIAPDLHDDDVDTVAELILQLGLDGVIATNTTISRQGLNTESQTVKGIGAGGLSGPVLQQRSVQVLDRLHSKLASQAVIISAGGVLTGKDVAERLQRGADLVQGYTGFIYQGPFWVRGINKWLSRHLPVQWVSAPT